MYLSPLIEPYWNVNLLFPYLEVQICLPLIEPYWNVNAILITYTSPIVPSFNRTILECKLGSMTGNVSSETGL